MRSATGPSAAAAAAAVLAALDLQEFVAIHNRWTRARGLPDFAIGVGIDSGPLVLGEIGAEHRRELALIGEVVPLAARMESASKLGQHRRIAISQRTRQLLGDRVATAPLTGMRCRGATAPMTSFEVIDWCGPRPTPA